MSMFKRIICVLLCAALMHGLVISTFATQANAAEGNPDADAFFTFVPGPEKMNADGDFTFSFHSGFTAKSRFKPNNTSIDIWVAVWLRDIDKSPTWTDPLWPETDKSKTMSVSLYKVGKEGEADTFIGSYSACANNKKTKYTFSNLDVNEEYYLEFESISTLGERIRFDGKGNVSSVTVTKA